MTTIWVKSTDWSFVSLESLRICSPKSGFILDLSVSASNTQRFDNRRIIFEVASSILLKTPPESIFKILKVSLSSRLKEFLRVWVWTSQFLSAETWYHFLEAFPYIHPWLLWLITGGVAGALKLLLNIPSIMVGASIVGVIMGLVGIGLVYRNVTRGESNLDKDSIDMNDNR